MIRRITGSTDHQAMAEAAIPMNGWTIDNILLALVEMYGPAEIESPKVHLSDDLLT